MDSSDFAPGCDEQRNNMVRMYRSGDMTSMATQFRLWLYHNSVLRPLGRPTPEGIRQADQSLT